MTDEPARRGADPGGRRGAVAAAVRPASRSRVVHRPRYDDWSLPKGKLDRGEHPLDAAVREVAEETGLRAVVGRRLPTGVHARAGPQDRGLLGDERVGGRVHRHRRGRRAALAAGGRAGGAGDLRRGTGGCWPTSRASDAADRDAAAGPAREGRQPVGLGRPDDLRPLDGRAGSRPPGWPRCCRCSARGGAARRRRRCAAADGGAARRAARACRCRAAPSSARRSSPPTRRRPGGRRAAARPAPGAGGTVVCSQGGAIPSVLLGLGVRGTASPGSVPPAAKGSAWALGGRAGALARRLLPRLQPDPDALNSSISARPRPAAPSASRPGGRPRRLDVAQVALGQADVVQALEQPPAV